MNVISWAPIMKENFGLDTIIALKERIDISAGIEITESMLQNVTIQTPPWYLTFSITSQSQLDTILKAVSDDTPIIIDIEGIGSEQIKVPNGRRVAVLAKSDWTFGKRLDGLVISFR